MAVYGHYPPPITGERLCCRYLIERLESFGVTVRALDKRDGLLHTENSPRGWLILGGTLPGFVRDGAILRRQHRVRQWYVHVHNISWTRIVAHSWWRAWTNRHRRVTYVVLTEAAATAIRKVGAHAVVLNNTVTAPELVGLKVDPTSKRLIWMAAITTAKGFPRAYEAFLIVKQRDPAWVFDVYGEGLPPSGYPEARFHGVVSGAAKRSAWAAGGILILPSSRELQPLAILEAMSVGAPIVASAVGGIPELLGSGPEAAGLAVPDPTPQTLASAIVAVQHDGLNYGAHAWLRFSRHFSPEAFDLALAALLEDAT